MSQKRKIWLMVFVPLLLLLVFQLALSSSDETIDKDRMIQLKLSRLFDGKSQSEIKTHHLDLFQPRILKPTYDLSLGYGAISGKITETDGTTPIVSVTVTAVDTCCHNTVRSVDSDVDGNYLLDSLPPAVYKLETSNDQGYVDEWYNDKSTYEQANPVSVTAGDTVKNKDFGLRMGGTISGTVKDNLSSAPLPRVLVYATPTSGEYSGSAFTDFDGSYDITGLPTGSYRVHSLNGYGYIDVYFLNKLTSSSADLVSVTEGSTTSNINFALVEGGKIKGHVYKTGGSAFTSCILMAINTTDQEWVKNGFTDDQGAYSISGLFTGDWKVIALGDTTYAFEFYNNKDDWSLADVVHITSPDSTSNIDFTLELGGSISGTVYKQDGSTPLSEAYVAPFNVGSPAGVWVSVYKSGSSKADGSYKMDGLRSGKYFVLAEKKGYAERWYNDKAIITQAETVSVTMPDNIPNIDFRLPATCTGVEDQTEPNVKELKFSLQQNYPNPFNPVTSIQYTVFSKQTKAVSGRQTGPLLHTALNIYNILGQKVKTLVNEKKLPGEYKLVWDGKDDQGKEVSSGIYFYRLKVDDSVQVKKMVLIR